MTILDRISSGLGVSLIALQLKVLGFQRVAEPLLHSNQDDVAPTKAEARQCRRRLQQSLGSARLPWSSCLTRAIWLTRQLRSDRIDAGIQLGVHADASATSAFSAHAWVQVGTLRLDQDETVLDRMITLKPARAISREKRQ